MWDNNQIPNYYNQMGNRESTHKSLGGRIGADYNVTNSDVITYAFRL
jgi:hypothetical protein